MRRWQSLRGGSRRPSEGRAPWRDRAIGSPEPMPPHCAAQDRDECPPHAATRATELRHRRAGMAGNEPVTPVCVLGAEHVLCSGYRCPTGASIPLQHQRLRLLCREGEPPRHLPHPPLPLSPPSCAQSRLTTRSVLSLLAGAMGIARLRFARLRFARLRPAVRARPNRCGLPPPAALSLRRS